MKILKRILLILTYFVIILLIAGFFFLRYIGRRSIPDYNQEVVLNGLTDEVTVYRDSFAIPHVYAKNEADLYRTVGYVVAQDRLWQMDLIRRVTQGRLSEIFGEEYVDADMFLRALRITEKSEMVFRDCSDAQRKSFNAFADGVTQYIEQHIHTLPPEFAILGYNPDPWKSEHSLNFIGYMAWDLAKSNYAGEIIMHKLIGELGMEKATYLFPDVKERKEVVYPDFKIPELLLEAENALVLTERLLENLGVHIFSGSNNWAVSGTRSATGMPLLANDMHLGFSSQGIWYPMHQVIEGALHVTGIGVPGAPLIVAGHNENIAWGLTNVAVDDIDLYVETLNPDNPNEYLLNGAWMPLEIREEKIFIKGGDSIILENRFTHRGPVISGFKDLDQAISMRWNGNDFSNEVRALYLLNRAGNWDEFKEALRTFNALSQNIVYADVEGNIGMYAAGNIPIRQGKGYLINPGDTTAYDWTGRVPFEQHPYSYNPENGILASANNKTVGNEYPYYIGHGFASAYRINRIRTMLAEKEKLTTEDFMNMQADQTSNLAEIMLPDVLEVLENNELDHTAASVFEMLNTWDLVYGPEDPEPLIFENLYHQLIENLLKDDLGAILFKEYHHSTKLPRSFMDHFWRHKSPEWCDDVTTPDIKETFEMVVLKSFSQVVRALVAEYGEDPVSWHWADAHALTLEHPLGAVSILDKVFKLNRGPYRVGGSFHTVSPYKYEFGDLFKPTWGASHRHIYNTADWDGSFTIIPTGISGIPASPHYCDQTEWYLKNKYHTDPFTRKAVEAHARYLASFKPKGE